MTAPGTEGLFWDVCYYVGLQGEAEMLQTVLILLTHCGHQPGRNTATQQSPALRGVLSFQWEDERRLSRPPRFRQFGLAGRPARAGEMIE
jgi:hypothetical protein